MGNEQSSASKTSGVPFVSWRTPAAGAGDSTSAIAEGAAGAMSVHFAEPSCYKYDNVAPVVTASVVFTDPPKADSELVNRQALLGCIAVIERGGRVHFPEIVRRVLAAGAVGCIFIERSPTAEARQSLFDGFHSSGRQQVRIPIVLLAKFHADQFLRDKPARVSIELLAREQAIRHVVMDDAYFAVATAARAGDVELLKHLLYSDSTGSVLEVYYVVLRADCVLLLTIRMCRKFPKL